MNFKVGVLEDGKPAKFNLEALIDSRLLIQGMSGSGKSYFGRKVLEQSYGEVPHHIIDWDGEYYTLKEEFDYVLVGRGDEGEIPINMRYIGTLAVELWKNRINAIIDLSELPRKHKTRFVKEYAEALLEAHRSIWSPLIVLIDEAHNLAPEKGRKTSQKNNENDSTEAIIDLCSNGRKRGICAILITQRLTKLNNDTISEMGNRVFGRTVYEIDKEKVAKELGMKRSDADVFADLKNGEFFAFGQAISDRKIVKFQADRSITTHPKIGKSKFKTIPKATKKVKDYLLKLVDIPEEAEKELKSKEDLKKKVTSLEKELTRVSKNAPDPAQIMAANTTIAEAQKIIRAYEAEKKSLQADLLKISDANSQLLENTEKLEEGITERDKIIQEQNKVNMKYSTLFGKLGKLFDELELVVKEGREIELPNAKAEPVKIKKVNALKLKEEKQTPRKQTESTGSFILQEKGIASNTAIQTGEKDESLTPANQNLLSTIARFYPNPASEVKVSLLSGISRKKSTYRNGIGRLRTLGYIKNEGNGFVATAEGYAAAGEVKPVPTDTQEMINYWKKELSPAVGKLLDAVIQAYPGSISKEDISLQSGIDQNISTFRNGLGQLNSLELISVDKDIVVASKELMEA